MEKLLMYLEIHQLNEQGFKTASIAKKLHISRNTVYKYLNMTVEEASNWVSGLSSRRKKLDPYREWIVGWLKEHPDLSSAQIEDWLKERFSSLKVRGSTVRHYVGELRNIYHILKEIKPRTYEAVNELPMGQQIQVDWGEIILKNTDSKEAKLYFITFVLSHSRYKYVEWLDRPFTTQDTIECHERAFQYFGGVSEEIVYDQDHLITVSENAGDIILTGLFQAYKKERGFRIYLCRKADPESKGKVENVVKYIKHNFAKHRVYANLEVWNEKCLAWLERTGNYNVHHTTKKRPVEVHALEKQHLNPVSSILSLESNPGSSIPRTVHKDNIIHYKSNRYSVPLGTFRPRGDNTVYVEVTDGALWIRATPRGEVLAKHPLSHGKGQLIKNTKHSRDRSKGIQAYKETVIRQFQDQEMAELFIQKISESYPRYIRDQLQTIQNAFFHFRTEMDEALRVCIDDQLWSANDIRDIAKHLVQLKMPISSIPLAASVKMEFPIQNGIVQTRKLDTYLTILGGM